MWATEGSCDAERVQYLDGVDSTGTYSCDKAVLN